jgi:hypothetical protein
MMRRSLAEASAQISAEEAGLMGTLRSIDSAQSWIASVPGLIEPEDPLGALPQTLS